jgi:GNAT superfamily N-acetyltransferase
VAIEIVLASTDAEREAVFGLRYQLYCEGQGLLRERADHESRTLREPDDEHARQMIAVQDGEVIGALRIQWGGDAPFGAEVEATFATETFSGQLERDQLAVGSRFVIHPNARGTTLMVRIMRSLLTFCVDQGVELLFGDCEPHLVQVYRGMGFRTYKPLVNHETSGILVPLVLAVNDLEHMVRVRSPLRGVLKNLNRDSFVGDTHYASLVPATDAIASADPRDETGQGEALVAQLLSTEEHRPDLFRELTANQVERLLARSDILRCAKGDALIRVGHTSRTLYVVLEGTLEVRRNGQVVAVASTGDVFGEIAFLIDTPRTADVFAAHDGVRVLTLSEANLRKLIGTEPELAAKLLLNLARALCYKLATDVPEAD